MPSLKFIGEARRTVKSFIRSPRGAAMLAACGMILLTLVGTGGLMTNYAWREAQWEELRAVVRAAVSSVGPLLATVEDAKTRRQIQERVASFAEASMPSLSLEADDVTVDHDSASRVTTISASGVNVFDDIFNDSQNQGPGDAVGLGLAVKLEFERYEVALALDASGSMEFLMPGMTPGTTVRRIDGLKTVMHSLADVMASISKTSPGSLMVSVVPYGSAVNVADTATNGPAADAYRTAAKERYVRMLAGAPEKDQKIDDTLKAARDALAAGGGHWVDTYHQYGVGADLGVLRKQGLPAGVLNNSDWNLRRQDVELDVRAQIPGLDTGAPKGYGHWLVNDEDFWNGCVMARWGAYWNESARPNAWTPDDLNNWPAAKAVDAWSPRSNALPASTPLHLSDAPPDAKDPHTLFTAYSWPDARIGGYADHRLVLIMNQLVDGRADPLAHSPIGSNSLLDYRLGGDNDWSHVDTQRGAGICPPSPILPLTGDPNTLRQATNDLKTTSCSSCPPVNLVGGTYQTLGIVWGLRTISPLWQQVWQVADSQGVERPTIPCVAGEESDRCLSTNKSILLISDGANYAGELARSSLQTHNIPQQDGAWRDSPFCGTGGVFYLPNYHWTWREGNEADFNDALLFRRYLQNGSFGSNMGDILDAFRIRDRWATDTPARRQSRQAMLETWSPWDLFRGLDATVVDELMDERNAFGFNSRPVHVQPLCRPSSAFTAYGRINDHVYVGNTPGSPATPLAPVADAAPFNTLGLPSSMVGDGTPNSGNLRNSGVLGVFRDRLDDWLLDSCRIAADRNVRINAVFIGRRTSGTRRLLRRLERCVDAAGGDPNIDDVYVTPDTQSMTDAFNELFVLRRSLKFSN